jgi:hypothetical protein
MELLLLHCNHYIIGRVGWPFIIMNRRASKRDSHQHHKEHRLKKQEKLLLVLLVKISSCQGENFPKRGA